MRAAETKFKNFSAMKHLLKTFKVTFHQEKLEEELDTMLPS